DKQRMMENLSQMPHVVVGTIGRLKDLFVDEAVLRLDKAKMIVIDEADMTLEMGFLDDVDQICSRLPDDLQMLVFSATIPAQMQPFLRKYMNNPVKLETTKDKDNQPKIRHVLVNCRHVSYQEKLLKILPGIQPYVCIIFARKKEDVISTAALLKENGYDVIEMHSDLSARERRQNLKRITSNDVTYIVCSDIMARGLDIEAVSHVISLGLPSTLSYYTHRSGRTGRAGRSGTSYVLYNQNDISGIKTLRNQGFQFEYEDYRRGKWVEARAFDYRPKKTQSEADIAVAKVLNKPVKKVKPGYKKKRQEEVDAIRRRERRLMIRESIRQQKKERAKKAQREKGGY
ncbi:MAG: DEAD/DEAH box helicase, partial [Erysipelotrichaceae bacterium]|nr:DEAD/DEAH box helicase [Erysipelotrichaceae bacterium]